MTADDRSHTADALTEVADYHVAECIDMHGDQGEDGPRPDCCFHARAAYAVGDAARLLRTTPTDSERASTHSAECWRWHGDCARARLVEVTAERARALLDAATPETPERCIDTLGSRPSWMGVDQYDPCRCKLPNGHDGDHLCSHDAAEPNNHPGEKRTVDNRQAHAELIAAAPDLIAGLLAERDEYRRQLDTLRNAIGHPAHMRLLADTFDLPILARIAAAVPQDPEGGRA